MKRSLILDPRYRLEFLDGNHGVWLFIFEDDKLLFEQPGFKSDKEAEVWGRKYLGM